MTSITIDGKDYEGKVSFAFARKADTKYPELDEKGKEEKKSGMNTIYLGLLQEDTESIVAFWDCALAHHKQRPGVDKIEAYIEEHLEETGDNIELLREAFQAIDQSGFFKRKAQKVWKGLESMKNAGSNDEEKEKNKMMYDMMMETKKELEGSTTTA